MSERFYRCAHCGLPHDATVLVCPTTGLRIGRASRAEQRQPPHARGELDSARLVGRVLDGKYRITELIGSGGMSAVYEAEHLGLGRVVALKVLHPGLCDDREAIARLGHEAAVVSAIAHPNICEVFDLGRTSDGSPYLVMERLRGESLAERIARGGPLGFAELAPILLQILAALVVTHEKGILHRDLKPENVFIQRGSAREPPSAKLLDFGISKSMSYDFVESSRITNTGMVMGTPYYMAPEQARGDSNLDQRVDMWALGVILYESLSGRRPFVATNYNALLVKILTSRPRALDKLVPSIPEPLSRLVDKAMSKLREDRFQTARELCAEIERVRRLVSVEAAPAAPACEGSSTGYWGHTVDDPPTFADDPGPIEATVQEVARDERYYQRLPRGTGQSGARTSAVEASDEDEDDTEVMTRAELGAVRGRREDDTEIMTRAQLDGLAEQDEKSADSSTGARSD